MAKRDEAVTPAIEVNDVWAGYDGQVALKGVTFSIEPGCLAGLVGPNGSGKSTLLQVILGLHKPWRGDVHIFGESNRHPRGRIGYMPQSELVDWSFPVTVLDVVLMGRYGRIGRLRKPSSQDREVAFEALERVRMADRAKRRISELSGGEQRRVLIARALAQEAKVLLLDEPFAALDAAAQHDLLRLFDDLRDAGRTIFVASHDLSCVASAFDHAVFLNRKVIAFGRLPEVFTEEVLNETFERHLLLVNVEGKVYAAHK